MPNNITPHDWHTTHDEQHEQPPDEQTPTQDLHQHRCPYCTDTFTTHRAVRTHMRFAHDMLHTVWQCVTAPICPYCSTHFADRISAVQHVMNSINKNGCITDQSYSSYFGSKQHQGRRTRSHLGVQHLRRRVHSPLRLPPPRGH